MRPGQVRILRNSRMTRCGILDAGKGRAAAAAAALAALILEKKAAGAVLVQKVSADGLNAPHALVSDPSGLAGASPFHPLMPVNAGGLVSEITGVKPPNAPIAAFLRPCESRALVELAKLKQASLESVIIIGFDCPGTRDLREFKGAIKDPDAELAERMSAGTSGLRAACAVCPYPVPQHADLKIRLFGAGSGGVPVEAATEKGAKFLESLGMPSVALPAGLEEAAARATASRNEERKKRFAAVLAAAKGPSGLAAYFSKCIRCQNCRRVCPVCYCRECFFDSPTFDTEGDKFLNRAKSRSALRLPADTLLFHLTRMNHMAASCVNCGMCTQACPSGIDVGSLFSAVGDSVQALFGYKPGLSMDHEIPFKTFREDELEAFGN